MTAETQTFVALIIVAVTVAWLVRRALVKRKNPGCGGDCGCPATEIRSKLRAGSPPS